MFTITDAQEGTRGNGTASCPGCTYTPDPEGPMGNKSVYCPAVTVPPLSFAAARCTLRDGGFFCFGDREALASVRKTEHVKGEECLLPFIPFTLDTCSSGKVLGETSVSNTYFQY